MKARVRAWLVGAGLIAVGAALGVAYPWVLLAGGERAVKVLVYTASAISILLGALAAAAGLALILGWVGRGSCSTGGPRHERRGETAPHNEEHG